jgi:hypothetical protein
LNAFGVGLDGGTGAGKLANDGSRKQRKSPKCGIEHMTVEGFRRLALSLPDSLESSHQDHPDFRVSGKIFATLGYPDSKWGTIKLTARQQAALVASHPEIFEAVSGSWGLRGATNVQLRYATSKILLPAIMQAWRNTASPRLLKK